ncbi:MAG: hypothetical protein ACYS32_03140 [Planctomycetota bacterium]
MAAILPDWGGTNHHNANTFITSTYADPSLSRGVWHNICEYL